MVSIYYLLIRHNIFLFLQYLISISPNNNNDSEFYRRTFYIEEFTKQFVNVQISGIFREQSVKPRLNRLILGFTDIRSFTVSYTYIKIQFVLCVIC